MPSKGRFMATLKDDTGTLSLVWFNAGYLREKLFVGHHLSVQGKCKTFNGYPQMANPKWELLSEEDRATLSLQAEGESEKDAN